MNLSISKRIALLGALAVLVLVVVGLAGFLGTRNLQQTIRIINNETTPRTAAIDDLKSHAYLTRVNALRHSLVLEEVRKNAIGKQIEASREIIAERQKAYAALLSDETDKKMFAEDQKLFAAYFKALDKLLEFSLANDNSFIRDTIDLKLDPVAEKLRVALEEHQKYVRALGVETGRQSEASADRSTAFSALTILLGALAIGALAFFIRRGIVSGLTGVQTMVTRIEGDLDFSLRAPIMANDELGQMAGALNSLLQRLQTNLRAISQSAGKVASAAATLTESSDQVARASAAQSGSATDMAASVEELSVSISHVGDRANDTRRSTLNAGELAQNGKAVVGQTVADIRSIAEAVEQASLRIRQLGEQSARIAGVVAVIREVADQTNLLALNAAIEAARAGEQGRGFAVVADEVRKLAERTAQSTQEITAMVDAVNSGAKSAEAGMNLAVERVAAGVARTDAISDAIHQISESSAHTIAMVNEIGNAISEQGSASTSIAQHVENIAQMAQECNAAATGSAGSAQQLDQLAAEMRRLVDAYRL